MGNTAVPVLMQSAPSSPKNLPLLCPENEPVPPVAFGRNPCFFSLFGKDQNGSIVAEFGKPAKAIHDGQSDPLRLPLASCFKSSG